MQDEISHYKKLVANLADDPSSPTIQNRGLPHAEIILETLLRNAKNEVLILTTDLEGPIYRSNSVVEGIKRFLDRNPDARLKAILDEAVAQDNPLHELLNVYARQIAVRRRGNSTAKKSKPPHFMLVDGVSFRLETGDQMSPTAIAQFNNRELGHQIEILFDSLFALTSVEDAGALTRASHLSISSILVPEHAVGEGMLIRSTSTVWAEVVGKLGNDWTEAFRIPPEKWEEIIAGAFKRASYDEVILTPRSGDHGRDVIAIKRGIGSIKIIGSVKAYKPDNLVPYDAVRSLLGVLSGEQNASKGLLATTSEFPPRIDEDPFIRPFMPTRLELMNGKRLRAWLLELSSK